MKRRTFLKLTLCLLLALSCLLSSCKEQPETPEDREIPEDPEVVYTYKTEVDESLLCTNGAGEYFRLANKEHPLTKDYAPENLVAYTGKTYYDKEVLLEARVASALLYMTGEMKADGVRDEDQNVVASYTFDIKVFDNYVAFEMSGISKEAVAYFGEDYLATNYTQKGLAKLTRSDALLVVKSYSAEAGYSEHQTGLCIDFITSTMTELDVTFESTDAFRWLSENAYRFGFILRYPKEKEDVTGYSYEPWHYRFVGREAAAKIQKNQMTLEEFLRSE